MRALLILFVAILLMPTLALAQSGSNLPSEHGTVVDKVACDKIHNKTGGSSGILSETLGLTEYDVSQTTMTICPCAPRPGLWLERMVYCFASAPDGIIFQAVKRFINTVDWFYWAIVSAAVFTSFLIFGYKLTTGAVQGLKKETFSTIFKIAGVVVFFANFETFHEHIITITYGLAHIASEMLDQLGGVCQFSSGQGQQTPTLWAHFDCMFDKLFGISSNNLTMGMLGFLVLFALSSSLGVVVLVGMIYVFITLMLAAMRAVYSYLSAVLSISFLLLMAPIFVPLVLFSGQYSHRFHKYCIILLGHMITPMLLYLMMIIALIILKYSIFVGPTSLFGAFSDSSPDKVQSYSEAMDKGMGGSISQVYTEEEQTIFTMTPNQEANTANPNIPGHITAGEDQGVIGEGPQSNNPPPDPHSYKAGFFYKILDLDLMAQKLGTTKDNLLRAIILRVFATAIISYIVFNLLGSATKITNQLVAHAYGASGVTQNQMLGQATIQKSLAVAQEAAKAKTSGSGGFRSTAAGALQNSFDKMAGRRV